MTDIDKKMQGLKSVVTTLKKQWGNGAIMQMDSNKPVEDIPVIPTGIANVDGILGVGGFPRGRIIEIFGQNGSGKTTLALHAVAQAQRSGGTAAIIDAEHALDLRYAQSIGVDMGRLFLAQPDHGEMALSIARSLIESQCLDIIIIDSVAALTPQAQIEGDIGDASMALLARLMSSSLRTLTSVIGKSQTTVIFTNQLRQKISLSWAPPGDATDTTSGNALKFYASIRIQISKTETLKENNVPYGNKVKVKVVKNKVAIPFQECTILNIFGKGFQAIDTTLEDALEAGIIEQRGSWFYLNNERLGQGSETIKKRLEEDSALKIQVLDLLKSKTPAIKMQGNSLTVTGNESDND